jgi:hypothetical protein
MLNNHFATMRKGTLTESQERALVNLITRLGRTRFAEYRRRAEVGMTPIPRLSRGEAWKLINVISQDLEAAS